MSPLATLRIALLALRINKLRSALTMLGIIIGVAAVIIMIAVGRGAQLRVQDQIRSLGSNIVMVLNGTNTSGGARGGAGSQPTIFEEDAYALGREINEVQAAAPTLRGSGQVVAGYRKFALALGRLFGHHTNPGVFGWSCNDRLRD